MVLDLLALLDLWLDEQDIQSVDGPFDANHAVAKATAAHPARWRSFPATPALATADAAALYSVAQALYFNALIDVSLLPAAEAGASEVPPDPDLARLLPKEAADERSSAGPEAERLGKLWVDHAHNA